MIQLFGQIFRHKTTKDWVRMLDQQAGELGQVAEVEELRTRIGSLTAKGEQDLLSYFISQVDPFQRVVKIDPPDQRVIHYELPYHTAILRPSTVFNFHLPCLKDELSTITVDGSVVRFYAGDKFVAQYNALETIPEAVEYETVSILQLIRDYTGINPHPEQLRKMHSVVYRREPWGWTLKIPKLRRTA